MILIKGDLYIVIGWDCGTSNIQCNMHYYRIFLVSIQTVESLSSCVRTNLVSQLHWRRKNTSCLCEHYISLLICELECLQFPTTQNCISFMNISASNVHALFVKSSRLHCDHHFQSPYILLVSAWELEALTQDKEHMDECLSRTFKRTSQTSL